MRVFNTFIKYLKCKHKTNSFYHVLNIKFLRMNERNAYTKIS